ncbi:MAG TPA: hypothetical protein VFQ61_21195 [Polyangiaceae bacterium]|nr:hypothetical protein [Polyangiaceae bacterium]
MAVSVNESLGFAASHLDDWRKSHRSPGVRRLPDYRCQVLDKAILAIAHAVERFLHVVEIGDGDPG